MIPGLAFLYGGLAKRKNALQLLLAVVFSNAVVVFQWFLCGYSLAFSRTATNGFIGAFPASCCPQNSSTLMQYNRKFEEFRVKKRASWSSPRITPHFWVTLLVYPDGIRLCYSMLRRSSREIRAKICSIGSHSYWRSKYWITIKESNTIYWCIDW